MPVHTLQVCYIEGTAYSICSLTASKQSQRGSYHDDQFTMEDIARIGLLKMDFLGLANLTILRKRRRLLHRTEALISD